MIAIITATLEHAEDRAFMSRVYEGYHRLMFAAARQYTTQPEACEDLVQESLIRLMGHLATLRSLQKETLAAYIVTTVRNTWYNQNLREKTVLPQCVSLEEAYGVTREECGDFSPGLIEQVDCEQLLERIWGRLTTEERFLLEGKYALGYTDRDLAHYLGCKPGSVRMKLTRARRKAAQALEGTEEICDGIG